MAKKKRTDEDVYIVPLDNLTALWLAKLAQVTGTPAGEIVASMLHDIRVDDERTEILETVH